MRYPPHKICSKAIHTDYELASVLNWKIALKLFSTVSQTKCNGINVLDITKRVRPTKNGNEKKKTTERKGKTKTRTHGRVTLISQQSSSHHFSVFTCALNCVHVKHQRFIHITCNLKKLVLSLNMNFNLVYLQLLNGFVEQTVNCEWNTREYFIKLKLPYK